MNETMASCCLIFNPTAGRQRARALRQCVERLRLLGMEGLEVLETQKQGDALEMARAASRRGVQVVIAMGGDGTINEVINGVAGTQTAIGMLPAGTVNLTAQEIGVTRDWRRACDVIVHGETLAVPVGRVEVAMTPDMGAPRETRRFLMNAGVGLDAHAVQHISRRRKDYLGKAEYLVSGIRSLFAYAYPILRVEDEAGAVREGHTLIATNLESYGLRIPMAPGGGLTQPWLNTCLYGKASIPAVVGDFLKTLVGRHIHSPSVSFQPARRLTIRSLGEAAPVQIDGDFIGYTPVTIEIEPGALQLKVPIGQDRSPTGAGQGIEP